MERETAAWGAWAGPGSKLRVSEMDPVHRSPRCPGKGGFVWHFDPRGSSCRQGDWLYVKKTNHACVAYPCPRRAGVAPQQPGQEFLVMPDLLCHSD